MDLELRGKLALVTGSTAGIGKAIATVLAREGARVIVSGRTSATVDAAIGDIRTLVPDADLEALVSDNATAKGTEETVRRFPEVELLVNNLGIYDAIPFFHEGDDTWLRVFETNVLSGVRLARHYLEGMLAAGAGRVVFIASEAAISPPPEMASYSATKAMQLSVSRSLAELTKGTAVTVNAVMPGTTRSEAVVALTQEQFPAVSAQEAEAAWMREERPTSLIGRLIEPEEIAGLVAYVCSPLGAAVNGAALRVDGGIVRSIP